MATNGGGGGDGGSARTHTPAHGYFSRAVITRFRKHRSLAHPPLVPLPVHARGGDSGLTFGGVGEKDERREDRSNFPLTGGKRTRVISHGLTARAPFLRTIIFLNDRDSPGVVSCRRTLAEASRASTRD